ncbi:uncharacterized protein J3R85_015572 [Psidium guajava]|nr:uncharacterized protein J3R85_015572 [Psidium guajava]
MMVCSLVLLFNLHPRLTRVGKKQKQDSIPPRTVAGPAPSSHLNSREAMVEQDEAAKLNPSLEHNTVSLQHTHKRVSFPLSRQTN